MSFIGATASFTEAELVIKGFGFDGTVSFRPGTRFAPASIREHSDAIETYSPYLDKDMEDYCIHDAGDLDLPFGNRDLVLEMIEEEALNLLEAKKRLVSLGGEHLISLPLIQAYHQYYPDITILHLDAHADLRDDYLGEKLSHATVMRRVSEFVGLEKIISSGIRSGTKEEFKLKKPFSLSEIKEQIKRIDGPIYLSLDLDVLDPSIFPGTGTPEPGGYQFNQLMEIVYCLKDKNLVGADLVELSPPYDAHGNSSIVACKILREVLLLMLK